MESSPSKEWFYHQYVVLEKGLKPIGKELGWNPSKVARLLRKYGITVRGFASGKRIMPKGKDHPNFKNSPQINAEGYICVRTPPNHPCRRRYMPLHRLVMEQKIGKFLLPGQVVNHIDGNRQNNEPENLQLCASQSEHAKLGIPGMRRHKKLWDRNWLYEQYVLLGRSLTSIAKEVGCTEGAVRGALDRQKIPRRRYTFSKLAIESRKKGGHAKKPRQ